MCMHTEEYRHTDSKHSCRKEQEENVELALVFTVSSYPTLYRRRSGQRSDGRTPDFRGQVVVVVVTGKSEKSRIHNRQKISGGYAWDAIDADPECKS